MADRVIVYPGSIPLDTDLLQPQQNLMVAVGYALQASFGNNTVVVGLACNATAPASMQVSIGPGAIISPSVIETTPFGSLPADTTDPLVKMGINTTSNLYAISAPTTSGQSQNYLVQVSFSEADDMPASLTYYNSLNPAQPFTGPSNSGTQQNTRRAQRANLQIKVGSPAATGSQVTPPVDAGWTGLYVINVPYGATAITSSLISPYPNSPFLASFLSSHHGGVPGQAPKINLASEVQGVLSSANLPSAVGSSLVYAGNPNGHVAGSAASGATPPTMCWDTVDVQWWTCVTSGSTSTAQWATAQNSKNIQTYSVSSTFIVPAGVTRLRIRVWGAGGGGGGTIGSNAAGSGGGGGAYAEGYSTVTPGTSYAITVGAGGSGGIGAGTVGAGGSSSFSNLISATGGGAGNAANGALQGLGGSGGTATSGSFNVNGYGGGGSFLVVNSAPIGGVGGGTYGSSNSQFSASDNVGQPGSSPGGGGSGGSAGTNGGNGANGLVILEW